MKKPAISDSEVRLIVILLGMIFLACAYFFGLNRGLQNAQEIQAQCDTVQAEVDNLNSMVTKKKAIEDETAAMKKAIVDITAKYPVKRPTEKIIYELQKTEDMTEAHYSSIGFSMDEPVLPAENGIMGFKNSIHLSYNCPYDNMKFLFDMIKDDVENRMNVSAVDMVYDMENGNISGKMVLNMYYLTGTNREYEEIPEMEFGEGMDNIFLGSKDKQKHPETTLEVEDILPIKPGDDVNNNVSNNEQDSDADAEDDAEASDNE